MLFDRSLVLGPTRSCASSSTSAPSCSRSTGGSSAHLDAGDAVTCTAGPRPARIVTFGPRDFHQILKAKFGLAGSLSAC